MSKFNFVTSFLSVYRQNMINYPPRAVLEGGCRFDLCFFWDNIGNILKFGDDVYYFLMKKSGKFSIICPPRQILLQPMHYAIRADIFGRGGLSRTKRVSKFSFL